MKKKSLSLVALLPFVASCGARNDGWVYESPVVVIDNYRDAVNKIRLHIHSNGACQGIHAYKHDAESHIYYVEVLINKGGIGAYEVCSFVFPESSCSVIGEADCPICEELYGRQTYVW